MKILFVYLFCTKGGVETAIRNRIENVDLTNNTVDLLFFKDFGGSKMFASLATNIYLTKDKEKIGKLICQNNYDYVITIDTPEIFDVLKNNKYKGKTVLEVHTTYTESLKYLFKLKKEDIDFIIVPSCYEKKLVKEKINFEIDIFILPNPVDTNIFKKLALPQVKQKPILLWVGRLDKHKNWRLFLDIARNMKEISINKYEFWVVGGSHAEIREIKDFKEKIYSENLYDSVRWIPTIDYNKISRIYNYVAMSKGAYVLTSNNESFGMTVLEAMACSCPVVCNDVGAVRELVDNKKNGLLMNMNNIEINEIAGLIINFIQNSNLIEACKINALRDINSKYSKEIITQTFLKRLL